jgi:hypothetical protein
MAIIRRTARSNPCRSSFNEAPALWPCDQHFVYRCIAPLHPGRFRSALEAANHEQAGDLRKFVGAIRQTFASAKSPIRFGPGIDATTTILGNADSLRETTQAWRELSASDIESNLPARRTAKS